MDDLPPAPTPPYAKKQEHRLYLRPPQEQRGGQPVIPSSPLPPRPTPQASASNPQADSRQNKVSDFFAPQKQEVMQLIPQSGGKPPWMRGEQGNQPQKQPPQPPAPAQPPVLGRPKTVESSRPRQSDAPPWVAASSEEKKQEFRKELLGGQSIEKPKPAPKSPAQSPSKGKDVDKTIAERLFGKPFASLERRREEPVAFDPQPSHYTELPKLPSPGQKRAEPTKIAVQKSVEPAKPSIIVQKREQPAYAKEDSDRLEKLRSIKQITLQPPLPPIAGGNKEQNRGGIQGDILAAEQELFKLEDKLSRVNKEISLRKEELDERRYEQKQMLEQAEEERLLEEELEEKSRNLREQSDKTKELLESLEKKLALVEKQVSQKQTQLRPAIEQPAIEKTHSPAPIPVVEKELVVPTPPSPRPAVEYVDALKHPGDSAASIPVAAKPALRQPAQLSVLEPKVEEIRPQAFVSEEEESQEIIKDLGLEAENGGKAGNANDLPVPQKQNRDNAPQPQSSRRMYLRNQAAAPQKKPDESEEAFAEVYSQVKEQQKAEKQLQKTADAQSKQLKQSQPKPGDSAQAGVSQVGVNDLFSTPKQDSKAGGAKPAQGAQSPNQSTSGGGGEKDLFGQLNQVASSAGSAGGSSSLFKELDSISGAQPIKPAESKCPTCQSATPKVVYCPYCTTGMCVNCSPSIKSEGDSFVYTCPKCGEEVTVKKAN
ncbi:hypothetical protein HY993_04635 [Candidatus Micrarchaeota archaeon]|nr:hypothetical protein [Candidatus Micrarchaeota archaeon]